MEVIQAIVVMSKFLLGAPKEVLDAFSKILEALYKYSGESRERHLQEQASKKKS